MSEQNTEVRVPVTSDNDLVVARRKGRFVAVQIGFSAGEATLVATAISELARNIVHYAGTGEILISVAGEPGRPGIRIIAQDKGPGIADIRLAVQEGYSTSGGFGLGLPGVRRIVDEFHVASVPGQGTVVTIIKWKQG